MDGAEPGVEFRPEVVPRRSRTFVAVWAVGLAVVAVVAVLGRGVVPPTPVASAVPAVAVATTAPAPAPTGQPASPSAQPARVVMLLPHGPIATLVDDALAISGTVDGGVDTMTVIVKDIHSTLVGWTLLGPLEPTQRDFHATVRLVGVRRTDWLFIEIAATDPSGADPEIVRRAVQVASLDPTASEPFTMVW